MNNRGMLWVIPNEEDIIQEEFKREAVGTQSHMNYLQEFSDTYMLGFDFKEEDYQTAPCEIAALGHMVVKSEDNSQTIIFYLPSIVTDRQYNWLYNKKEELNKYIQSGAFSLNFETNEWNQIKGIENIMIEATRKNLKKEDKNEGVKLC